MIEKDLACKLQPIKSWGNYIIARQNRLEVTKGWKRQRRDEKGEFTKDTVEIQRVIQEYHEKGYNTKFNNLEEMDQYLEK